MSLQLTHRLLGQHFKSKLINVTLIQKQLLTTDNHDQNPLYQTHIPTTNIQKLLLFAGSSIGSLLDPYRDDLVAVSGETSGHLALKRLYQRMQADAEGFEILKQRPVVNEKCPDPDYLLSLPPNSFGRQYITFMRTYGISSDTRKPVKFVDDPELAYLMRRYRETHDFVHLLCRMKPNMLGEVIIKWVEAIQTDLPMCYGAAILGTLRLSASQRQLYQSTYLPYAFECGKNAKFLLACYFEKRWEQDINDLRRELNIPQATHSSMIDLIKT